MIKMSYTVWTEEYEVIAEGTVELTEEQIQAYAKECGYSVERIELTILEELGIEIEEEQPYTTDLHEILYGEEV